MLRPRRRPAAAMARLGYRPVPASALQLRQVYPRREGPMRRCLVLVTVLVTTLVGLQAASPVGAATTYTDVLTGTETSTGQTMGTVRTGVTFQGTAVGALPGSWTVVLNYTPPSPTC